MSASTVAKEIEDIIAFSEVLTLEVSSTLRSLMVSLLRTKRMQSCICLLFTPDDGCSASCPLGFQRTHEKTTKGVSQDYHLVWEWSKRACNHPNNTDELAAFSDQVYGQPKLSYCFKMWYYNIATPDMLRDCQRQQHSLIPTVLIPVPFLNHLISDLIYLEIFKAYVLKVACL